MTSSLLKRQQELNFKDQSNFKDLVTPSSHFQTRLLFLQTTNLHFLIIINKRYNFTWATFALGCLFWPHFQTSTFACYNICPFELQLLQRLLLLSALIHSRFNVSISFNFRRSQLSLQLSFPFDISFFPLWLHISFSILFPIWLLWLFCFLISPSFLLVQFSSAVIQIQTVIQLQIHLWSDK